METWSDCVRCRSPIPVGATRCLKCGKRYERGAGKSLAKSFMSWFVTAVLLFLAIKLLFNLISAGIAFLIVIVLWAAYRGYQKRIS